MSTLQMETETNNNALHQQNNQLLENINSLSKQVDSLSSSLTQKKVRLKFPIIK